MESGGSSEKTKMSKSPHTQPSESALLALCLPKLHVPWAQATHFVPHTRVYKFWLRPDTMTVDGRVRFFKTNALHVITPSPQAPEMWEAGCIDAPRPDHV